MRRIDMGYRLCFFITYLVLSMLLMWPVDVPSRHWSVTAMHWIFVGVGVVSVVASISITSLCRPRGQFHPAIVAGLVWGGVTTFLPSTLISVLLPSGLVEHVHWVMEIIWSFVEWIILSMVGTMMVLLASAITRKLVGWPRSSGDEREHWPY